MSIERTSARAAVTDSVEFITDTATSLSNAQIPSSTCAGMSGSSSSTGTCTGWLACVVSLVGASHVLCRTGVTGTIGSFTARFARSFVANCNAGTDTLIAVGVASYLMPSHLLTSLTTDPLLRSC